MGAIVPLLSWWLLPPHFASPICTAGDPAVAMTVILVKLREIDVAHCPSTMVLHKIIHAGSDRNSCCGVIEWPSVTADQSMISTTRNHCSSSPSGGLERVWTGVSTATGSQGEGMGSPPASNMRGDAGCTDRKSSCVFFSPMIDVHKLLGRAAGRPRRCMAG
jgi:hypothetical protein